MAAGKPDRVKACKVVLALWGAVALGGCQELLTEGSSAGAGVAAAAIAERVGGGAAVTTGIGLGTLAAARAGTAYALRRAHAEEQDRIAAVAGELPVGGVARWRSPTLPVELGDSGAVTVSRVISSGELDCKEIVFSVEDGPTEAPRRSFYTAAICRDGERWRWASAEPATARWGALQ